MIRKKGQKMNTVRTITFLIHADPNQDHSTISPLGRTQAEKCRRKLGEPSFDLIFRSPIPCTDETARVIALLDGKQWTRILSSLYFSTENDDDDIIRAALEKIQHPINLRMLLDQGELVQKALREKTLGARRQIYDQFTKQGAKKVLVVGHDILIQALCASFCGEGNHFIDQVIPACEGFLIKFDEAGEEVIGWEKAP